MVNIYALLIILVVITYFITTLFLALSRKYTLKGYAIHTFKWFCFGALFIYIFGWTEIDFGDFFLKKFPAKLASIPFYTNLNWEYRLGNLWNIISLLAYTFLFSLGISFSLIVMHFADTNKWIKVFRWNCIYLLLFFLMFSQSDAYFEWGIFIVALSSPFLANYLWSNTPDKVKNILNPITKEGSKEYDYFKD